MKRKFKCYSLGYKDNSFEVVFFSRIEDLYFEDMHPQEDTYDANGSAEALLELAVAFDLCINHPEIIVYLPLKRDIKTYNMVLTTYQLRGFKPSVWYKVKPYINRKNQIEDLVENFTLEKTSANRQSKVTKEPFIQKLLGDTVFCCYTLNDLKDFRNEIIRGTNIMKADTNRITYCWGLGFILNDELVKLNREDR